MVQVDAAEALHRAFDHRVDVALGAHVGADRERRAAQRLRERGRGLLVAIDDHDRRAVSGEPPHGGRADSARAARDERDGAVDPGAHAILTAKSSVGKRSATSGS